MKYLFSNRERILIALLAIVLVGGCYFAFVDQPIKTAMADVQSQKDSNELMLQSYQIRAAQLKKKSDALETLHKDGLDATVIPDFDNREAVLRQLSEALAGTQTYSLDFQDVTDESDKLKARAVKVTYQCAGYQAARTVIDQLYLTGQRALISDLTITAIETQETATQTGVQTVAKTAAQIAAEKKAVVAAAAAQTAAARAAALQTAAVNAAAAAALPDATAEVKAAAQAAQTQATQAQEAAVQANADQAAAEQAVQDADNAAMVAAQQAAEQAQAAKAAKQPALQAGTVIVEFTITFYERVTATNG